MADAVAGDGEGRRRRRGKETAGLDSNWMAVVGPATVAGLGVDDGLRWAELGRSIINDMDRPTRPHP